MSKRFLISDTHFSHKKILDYEPRPYNDINEMNNKLIENWNTVVNKEDIVWHLGDVIFGGKQELQKIMQKLNGIKYLILGNHDRGRSVTWWLDAGFDKVYEYPIIYNNFIMLSHEPLYLNKNMPYVNIHGHLHSTNLDNDQYINVGVENINYTPISFDLILNQINLKANQENTTDRT